MNSLEIDFKLDFETTHSHRTGRAEMSHGRPRKDAPLILFLPGGCPWCRKANFKSIETIPKLNWISIHIKLCGVRNLWRRNRRFGKSWRLEPRLEQNLQKGVPKPKIRLNFPGRYLRGERISRRWQELIFQNFRILNPSNERNLRFFIKMLLIMLANWGNYFLKIKNNPIVCDAIASGFQGYIWSHFPEVSQLRQLLHARNMCLAFKLWIEPRYWSSTQLCK